MVNSRLVRTPILNFREVTEKARAGCIARLARLERPASVARFDPQDSEDVDGRDINGSFCPRYLDRLFVCLAILQSKILHSPRKPLDSMVSSTL